MSEPIKLPRGEQSRVNGAKSKGPTTPEGRASICKAKIVHGFRASTVATHNEDHPAYDAQLEAYLAHYTPANAVETDLVGLLALNMWEIKRMASVESALFDLEIDAMDNMIEGTFQRMNEFGRLALAFKKSSGDRAFDLLRRYKSTAERAFHKTFQALEKIRKERQTQQPVIVPGEEKTISTVEPEKAPDPEPPPVQNAPEPPVTSVQPVKTVLQLVPKSTNPVVTPAEDPEWRPKFGS